MTVFQHTWSETLCHAGQGPDPVSDCTGWPRDDWVEIWSLLVGSYWCLNRLFQPKKKTKNKNTKQRLSWGFSEWECQSRSSSEVMCGYWPSAIHCLLHPHLLWSEGFGPCCAQCRLLSQMCSRDLNSLHSDDGMATHCLTGHLSTQRRQIDFFLCQKMNETMVLHSFPGIYLLDHSGSHTQLRR